MDEKLRIKELKNFQILDTPVEKKLNDFTKLASVLCDMPISFISFVDTDRVWYKTKIGIKLSEIPREYSFSSDLVKSKEDILVVDDALNDASFKSNPIVSHKNGIRSYVGVPLISKNGLILGTLSVADTMKRTLSKEKIEALKLLTNEVMDYLETRKMMISGSEKVNKRTDELRNFSGQSSSIFMQIEILKTGKIVLGFLSDGIQYLNSSLTSEYLKDHPKELLKMVHKDDYDLVLKTMVQSFVNTQPFELEFRVEREDKSICWYQAVARTETREDNRVVWYATFQDISTKKMYINTLEQMSFDISHILRKPITTLMSIISVIEIENGLDEEGLKMYAGYLKVVGEELDSFTKTLNESYYSKWMGLQSNQKPKT